MRTLLQNPVLWTGVAVLLLTFFLDLLELSFARAVWFLRTLRFWLYFVLHAGISSLAGYLLWGQVPAFLVAPLATFIGVAVVSNTDVRVGGYSLLPIAQLFTAIKAKMLEQAAEDKARELSRAFLAERLHRLPVHRIEEAFRAALIAANYKPASLQARLKRAERAAGGKGADYNAALIGELLRVNVAYVEQRIADWER